MKIYTKTGDGGETGLRGGSRVRKDDVRVEAYGDVDELNAAIGFARVQCGDREIGDHLGRIQGELLRIGSELALAAGSISRAAAPAIDPIWIDFLEKAIDQWEGEVLPLHAFVLPGGSPLGAALHIARSVCRRAERRIVALDKAATADPQVLAYMNRLSDFLFTAARLANHRANVTEVIWTTSDKR